MAESDNNNTALKEKSHKRSDDDDDDDGPYDEEELIIKKSRLTDADDEEEDEQTGNLITVAAEKSLVEYVPIISFSHPISPGKRYTLSVQGTDLCLASDISYTLTSTGKRKPDQAKDEKVRPFKVYLRPHELNFLSTELASMDKNKRILRAPNGGNRRLELEWKTGANNFSYKLLSVYLNGDAPPDVEKENEWKYWPMKLAFGRFHLKPVQTLIKNVMILVDLANDGDSVTEMGIIKRHSLLTAYFTALDRREDLSDSVKRLVNQRMALILNKDDLVDSGKLEYLTTDDNVLKSPLFRAINMLISSI